MMTIAVAADDYISCDISNDEYNQQWLLTSSSVAAGDDDDDSIDCHWQCKAQQNNDNSNRVMILVVNKQWQSVAVGDDDHGDDHNDRSMCHQ